MRVSVMRLIRIQLDWKNILSNSFQPPKYFNTCHLIFASVGNKALLIIHNELSFGIVIQI